MQQADIEQSLIHRITNYVYYYDIHIVSRKEIYINFIIYRFPFFSNFLLIFEFCCDSNVTNCIQSLTCNVLFTKYIVILKLDKSSVLICPRVSNEQ